MSSSLVRIDRIASSSSRASAADTRRRRRLRCAAMSVGWPRRGPSRVKVAVRARRGRSRPSRADSAARRLRSCARAASARRPWPSAGRSLLLGQLAARAPALRRRTAAGLAMSSTRRQSLAFWPRTPSVLVQKMSARSCRTCRLSVTRVRPPVPGSTPSSGTSGRLTALPTVVDQDDLVAGQRQFVAAAGAGAVDGGQELQARCRRESSRPLRVSLVNLQKLTFHAWLRDAQHEDVGARAEHLVLGAGHDDGAHFGMLEADAVDGVVELDVDAQVVAVELELVAGAQAGVLVEVGRQAWPRAFELRASSGGTATGGSGSRRAGNRSRSLLLGVRHDIASIGSVFRDDTMPKSGISQALSCMFCQPKAGASTRWRRALRSTSNVASSGCRAGVDSQVGLRIERGAPGEDALQVLHRFLAVGHGSQVALGADALHVVLRVGLQPDVVQWASSRLKVAVSETSAARGGDHGFGIDLDRLLERAPFVAAVGVLAVERLDLATLQPANFSISRLSSTNGKPEVVRQRRPSVDLPAPRSPISAMRGLRWPLPCSPPVRRAARRSPRARGAASASSRLLEQFADQQPFGRAGGHVAEQFGQRALQRVGHLQQHQDRGVADAVLEVGEMALGDAGALGQRLARHAAAGAQRAHALAQRDEERMLVGRLASGRGGADLSALTASRRRRWSCGSSPTGWTVPSTVCMIVRVPWSLDAGNDMARYCIRRNAARP